MECIREANLFMSKSLFPTIPDSITDSNVQSYMMWRHYKYYLAMYQQFLLNEWTYRFPLADWTQPTQYWIDLVKARNPFIVPLWYVNEKERTKIIDNHTLINSGEGVEPYYPPNISPTNPMRGFINGS